MTTLIIYKSLVCIVLTFIAVDQYVKNTEKICKIINLCPGIFKHLYMLYLLPLTPK